MARAAERVVCAAFGPEPSLDLWVVGSSPVGHELRMYAPEKQKATGCYGEKVFFYRAEMVGGRFRLPASGSKKAFDGDTRSPDAFAYDDFVWVSRDESEAFLARQDFKYLHQVMGAGAGEEVSRKQKWLAALQAKGLTVAQATGRRWHRVKAMRGTDRRRPALATRAQVEVAALPFAADGRKAAALAAEHSALAARLKAQQARRGLELGELRIPSAKTLAAKRAAEAKAAAPLA
jgi:hypothetical protein